MTDREVDGAEEGQEKVDARIRRGLRILPGDVSAAGDSGPSVLLIRQLKIPDLERLSQDLGYAQQLPGRVEAVQDAIQRADFGGADEALDDALQPVLAGPGSAQRNAWAGGVLGGLLRARRPLVAGVVLWLWFAALCTAAWYVIFS